MHGFQALLLAPFVVARLASSAVAPKAPIALAADRSSRPVALLRSEGLEGSRVDASKGSANALSSAVSSASMGETALLQVEGQTAEGSVRSRFQSVAEDEDETSGGAESEGAAFETITLTSTTTEFWEPTTQPLQSASFVMVQPDVAPQSQDGVTSDNAMRCKGNYVFDFPGATTQWKCQALATVPPASTRLTSEDVRYYQFCAQCPGSRCQLVQWCLEVDTNPGLEWRLYRNAAVAPDMWYMAAGHTMCTLPEGFFETQQNAPGTRLTGARGVQHQLACQEYAAKLNKPYYQFCSSCTAGEKCTIVDTCDRCISMDVTDWHVFKAELAGPPCATAR